MADTRKCEQCGTVFVPRREHARFCSARCRVTWNHEKPGSRTAGVSALDWSVTAMRDTTGRMSQVRTWDRPRALGAVNDAVWWVTIVDATLVRYHPDAYDSVLRSQDPAERQAGEDTMAGLRFVRNQMRSSVDRVDFISPAEGRGGPGEGSIIAWTWNSLPQPALTALSPRGRAWELTRYRAYETQLAGHTIGETFGRAAAFLCQAAAKADGSPAAAAASTADDTWRAVADADTRQANRR